jgi:hypothetical protein
MLWLSFLISRAKRRSVFVRGDAFHNTPSRYNCNPALDAAIDTLRSNAQSNYDSLQVRLEKRYSHGLQYEVAYTWAYALDNGSSTSLGSANNGDFRDQRFSQPTPSELNPTVPAGQGRFGFPVAARAPRQVQFALKFYF